MELKELKKKKTVVLIRHGESEYNSWAKDPITWLSCKRLSDPLLYDAPLTDRGKQQAARLKQSIEFQHILKDLELIVTSPLTRAIETSLSLFDGCGVPIVVQAMHSEVLDTSCDIGTQPKLLAEKFTALDFSHLNEHWWNHMKIEEINGKTLMKETKENARRRALEFKKWILERAEKKIVVVGHGAFFKILSESRLKMPNCGYRIMEL